MGFLLSNVFGLEKGARFFFYVHYIIQIHFTIFACRITIITLKTLYLSISPLLYTGSSFSLWKVTKIIFLFHQTILCRKKFCGYRFRLHVLLLKLSTVSINSLLRRVEFIDFCGWFLHASFLSDHFLELFTWKKWRMIISCKFA